MDGQVPQRRSHETAIKVSARLNLFLVALGKEGLAASFRLHSVPRCRAKVPALRSQWSLWGPSSRAHTLLCCHCLTPPASTPRPPPYVCWAGFCFLKISVIRLILLGWSAVISLSQCPNLNFSCKVPSVLSCHVHKFLGLRHMHFGGGGLIRLPFPK